MPHERKERDSPPEPWASLLKSIDALMKERVDVHCLGGFVVTLKYGISRTTSDIDILPTAPPHKLTKLQELGGQGSDLHQRYKVYLQPVTVMTYPEEYESRLTPMWPSFDLANLRIFALEAHDLALTKLERNSDVDRQDIQELARLGHLDPTTLRRRYQEEFRPNPAAGVKKHDLTLQLWLDMCWPQSGR